MNPGFKSELCSGGNIAAGKSVLDRQRERMQWQPPQNLFTSMPTQSPDQFSGLITTHSCLDVVKPDPEMDGYQGAYGGDQLAYGYMDQTFLQGNSAVSISVSPKKRKSDKGQSLQVKDKRIKGCVEEDNKSSNSKEASTNASSKEKSKVSDVQKPDYIHVRARRGQATDSHSLAERVRREKISERMKYLQDLVPGCNKITGKAGMLDEIINYVQSLQKQVEFLSMKLATVNPELDFNIDNLLTKEMLQFSTTEFPALGCSSEMANSAYFQLNSLEQVVSYFGLDMGVNSTEMALRRSISTPLSNPETYLDSSCFNQIQPAATWDADLQNLYKMELDQGTLMPFQSHQFAGSNEGSSLKEEM